MMAWSSGIIAIGFTSVLFSASYLFLRRKRRNSNCKAPQSSTVPEYEKKAEEQVIHKDLHNEYQPGVDESLIDANKLKEESEIVVNDNNENKKVGEESIYNRFTEAMKNGEKNFDDDREIEFKSSTLCIKGGGIETLSKDGDDIRNKSEISVLEETKLFRNPFQPDHRSNSHEDIHNVSSKTPEDSDLHPNIPLRLRELSRELNRNESQNEADLGDMLDFELREQTLNELRNKMRIRNLRTENLNKDEEEIFDENHFFEAYGGNGLEERGERGERGRQLGLAPGQNIRYQYARDRLPGRSHELIFDSQFHNMNRQRSAQIDSENLQALPIIEEESINSHNQRDTYNEKTKEEADIEKGEVEEDMIEFDNKKSEAVQENATGFNAIANLRDMKANAIATRSDEEEERNPAIGCFPGLMNWRKIREFCSFDNE